jgi:hypothetical protein
MKSLRIDRLKQVIESVNIERPQRVFIISRNEDYFGRLLDSDLLQDAEPVQLRHLYIEED